MKNFCYTLLLMLCSFTAFSQITITRLQFEPYMSSGAGNKMYIDTVTTMVNVGNTGGPNIYDFSNLPFYLLQDEKCRLVDSVPVLASRYPSGSVSYKIQLGSDTHYMITNTNNQQWASDGTASIFPSSSEYKHSSPAEIMFQFPVTYGAVFNQNVTMKDSAFNSSGQLDSARMNTIPISGIVDGYGTLKLPGGINMSCLRIRRQETGSYTYKAFRYLTAQGVQLMVETRNSQPDTGFIQTEFLAYFQGTTASAVKELSSGLNSIQLNSYPNPGKGTIHTEYVLPAFSTYTLKLYNILGEAVATIADKTRPAGAYSEQWETDGLPAGVYYLRLTTQAGGIVKKIILR